MANVDSWVRILHTGFLYQKVVVEPNKSSDVLLMLAFSGGSTRAIVTGSSPSGYVFIKSLINGLTGE
jgi:hypothetical protein